MLCATTTHTLIYTKGCDKRVYHVIEALVGLNHNVVTSIYQKGKAATSPEDDILMSLLNIKTVKEPLRRNVEESYR